MDWNEILTIVIPVFAFLGWVYARLDKRFDKNDQKFDSVMSEIRELRTSLNRMEGAFYSKDCCVLKHDKKNHDAM